MSTKKSLCTLLIVFSIIPVLFVSIVAHHFLLKKMIDVQTQNLKTLANTNGKGLETMIENKKTEISFMSEQERIRKIAASNNNDDVPQIERINAWLKSCKSNSDIYQKMTIYNTNQDIIACSDASYIEMDKGTYQLIEQIQITGSTAIRISTDDYAISIGSPIYDASEYNTLNGYIVASISLSYFEKFLKSITIGDTGYGILVSYDGTPIYMEDHVFTKDQINTIELTNIVQKNKQENLQLSGTINMQHDNNQIYGYRMIPEYNWILFVKQDASEIKFLTKIMVIVLSSICACLLIIIIFFANILSKKYTAPIIALRDAMRTASDGNLMVQSNIKSKSELGELSKNFNKMLHIIRTNYEDLASMHEELLSNEEQLRSNYDHIEYLAYHDTLTNLPNKLAFLNHVNTILIASNSSNIHAIFFVDLDNFKTVNDTLGHEYGDSLLIRTAQILGSLLPQNSILARAGGDEFLIFIEDIPSKESAEDFASQIIKSFKDPIPLEEEIVHISISVGIAIYPENGLSTNTLIKNSDIAMYKSKDTGKNKFTLFDAKMEEELHRNTIIIEILRNAISNNEIYVKYQPQIDLKTNQIVGYEALMRIESKKLGPLAPNEFIPIAEESGLIIELSSWLIHEACRFTKSLMNQKNLFAPVSVNISSIQMNRSDFTQIISDTLQATQLPPDFLTLEITETSLVSSIMDVTILLTRLKDLGVKVSLDDFGTGYSSLNYLTKMPIDTLKIDKSFIDHIHQNNKDASIAKSIIRLAHSLGLKVVAEGVENSSQLNLLQEYHCDIVQGYIFSAPLSDQELLEKYGQPQNK